MLSCYNNCGRIFAWSTLQICIPQFQTDSLNQTYNPIVPEYLHGRTKATILHCLYRRACSNKYTSNDVRVVNDCSGVFEVKGKEVIYTVNFGIEDGMP